MVVRPREEVGAEDVGAGQGDRAEGLCHRVAEKGQSEDLVLIFTN